MKTGLYDLSRSPVTWEFLNFALQAKAAGCERIMIVPGKRFPSLTHYDDATVERRIRTMMFPLCDALGMSALYPETREAAKELAWMDLFPEGATIDNPIGIHGIRHIIGSMPLGIDLRVNPQIASYLPKRYEGAITMTIREQTFQANRNSNIPEWIAAARKLQAQGHHVVFIPDYEALATNFEEFDVCQTAAIDMDVRIALYSVAAVNLFIANGPCSLAWMTSLPCIIMKLVTSEYLNVSELTWLTSKMPPGTQPHWFGPHQRLVWKDDTTQNIVDAVQDWCAQNPERIRGIKAHA